MFNKSSKRIILIVIVFILVEASAHLAYLVFGNPNVSKSVLQKKLLKQTASQSGVLGEAINVSWDLRQNAVHPYLGFVRDYDLKNTTSADSDQSYASLINEYGFLGENPIQKKSPNTLIIAILGGSVAEQFYLTQKDTFIRRLQSLPSFRNKTVRLINLALGAYKQPQQLIALNYILALGGEFDIVLNIDGFNELSTPFAHNQQNTINPIFPWEWQLWSKKHFDNTVLAQMTKINNLKSRKNQLETVFKQYPLSNSYFLLSVWNAQDIYYSSAMVKEELKLNELLATATSTYQTKGPPQHFNNADEFFDNLVTIWTNSSFEMNALSYANDFLYLHFLQPNQYFSNSKKLTIEERQMGIIDDADFASVPPSIRENLFNSDSELVKKNVQNAYNYLTKALINKGYPLLIEAGHELADRGIKFTDLTMVFAEEEGTIYSDICCHYNERGNQILNERIIEAIAKNYLVLP